MNLRKRVTMSIVGVFLFICIVVVADLTLRPREMKVSVISTGFTVDSRGNLLALLLVANQGDVAITRQRDYFVEVKQPSTSSKPDTRLLTESVRLGPGESETVYIPAMTNGGDWRATFLCFPYGVKNLFSEVMGRLHIKPDSWSNPTNVPVHTDWMRSMNMDSVPPRPK